VSPDQVFVILMGSIGAWTIARILRGPIGEARARRIGGQPQTRAVPDDHQLVDLQARLAALEERLDFTERVLLQERQAGQLKQGDVT
jgi:hypothetical protein